MNTHPRSQTLFLQRSTPADKGGDDQIEYRKEHLSLTEAARLTATEQPRGVMSTSRRARLGRERYGKRAKRGARTPQRVAHRVSWAFVHREPLQTRTRAVWGVQGRGGGNIGARNTDKACRRMEILFCGDARLPPALRPDDLHSDSLSREQSPMFVRPSQSQSQSQIQDLDGAESLFCAAAAASGPDVYVTERLRSMLHCLRGGTTTMLHGRQLLYDSNSNSHPCCMIERVPGPPLKALQLVCSKQVYSTCPETRSQHERLRS